MIKLIIKTILSLGSILWLPLTHAEVSTFKPSFPQFSNTAKQRQAMNQIYALGEVSFSNDVRVPFYGVTAPNPVDDGLLKGFKWCTAKSCHFDFKLDANLAKQLKLVGLPEIGTVLVPKDWQDIQADAGANGTGYALITSPDQKQAIQLYDSSLCVGCGMPYASLYFPELLKESIENEFGGYKDSQKLLNVVHPSKHSAFFSYQIPKLNNKTHGVAKYRDDGDFNFREIKVTLDKSQQHLVGPILNFYQFTH
ncbi:DUF4850 domain-containing protein [Acinetobacter soli]|uniref:DUF4850 domain-containing protein n=1 Tax=Acinetobacter soli NIPH 2899 TaxID=1217677 RepID=A0ABN0JY14_9GAMM|nr:DUF4850 domain-containing protein [Acinetobacter soli]ENV60515.1 hypothetical protein F950_01597 [Acinetobacter soli NIPH 2899]